MMKYHYVLMLLVCVVAVAGKKYCISDEECTELGDLFCIKSQCDLGVCGCPRGEAAVFLGSVNKYGCAKVKKVGESCSTDGDGGVCGASGSECSDGKCVCGTGTVSRWDGELCATGNERFVGETCGPNGVGSCTTGTCQSPDSSIDEWHNPVQYNVPTCACDNNQKLVITNAYSDPSTSAINPFVSSSIPICVDRTIGDSCLMDSDCDLIGTAGANDAECNNNVCECPGTEVPNYERTQCFATGLDSGATCFPATGSTCDGNKGLVCGNQCDIGDAGDPGNIPGTNTATCTCGPKHKPSGNGCALRQLGDSCSGDYNCKGFSERGICVDGTCQNAGFHVTASVSGVLTMLVFALLHNLMF